VTEVIDIHSGVNRELEARLTAELRTLLGRVCEILNEGTDHNLNFQFSIKPVPPQGRQVCELTITRKIL